MKHIISVLVENKSGVLARIVGLFSARGYNIASLAVSATLDPNVSYMTIVIESQDEKILEQIKKQLNKLINIVTVIDFTKKEHVGRELVLANVKYSIKNKARLGVIFNKYIGKIVYHKDDTAIIEAVGDRIQIKSLLDELNKLGVRELARTGQVAISKKIVRR